VSGRPSSRPRPYPDLTDAELRAQLDLLPTWVLEQKAAANRQVIAVTAKAGVGAGGADL
jgi:hypothetical protein